MKNIRKFLKRELLFSIPKSLFVNFKLLPFSQAIKLPILVRFNTRIIDLNGKITIVGGGKIGCVRIGFGGVSEFDEVKQRSIIKFSGNISLTPPCNFGAASRIIVEKNAQLTISKNFYNSANLTISCRGNTTIGENVLVSWNVWICDTDFHQIRNLSTGKISKPDGRVMIGNNVWIGAHSSILKNAIVPNGCIIASHSLVREGFEQENSLIAGIPAKIKSSGIRYVP